MRYFFRDVWTTVGDWGSDAWEFVRDKLPIWGFPALFILLGLIFLCVQVVVADKGPAKPQHTWKAEWNQTIDVEQSPVERLTTPVAVMSAPASTPAIKPAPAQSTTMAASLPNDNSPAALSPGTNVPGANATFVFKCYGRAHGVGMCMDGVLQRAQAGQSYRTILNYYYTGITFTKIDDSRPIRVKGRDGQVRTWSMHDYLQRLQEEPNDSPMEELKALYVAARTYTLSCIARGKHAGAGYDVCSSGECCQACDENKSIANYPNNNKAIDETAGEIITYNGQPIIAAYCGSCGGHTDNNEDVWGGAAIPYLRGKPDSYCAKSPRYITVKEMSVREFQGKFGVGELKLVDLSDRTPGGRVKNAKIVGSAGTKAITGKSLEDMLGFRGLRIEYSFR